MERLLGWGLVDTFRTANPETQDRFSWFDYRSKGFDDNRGLRIDLLLASAPRPNAASKPVSTMTSAAWKSRPTMRRYGQRSSCKLQWILKNQSPVRPSGRILFNCCFASSGHALPRHAKNTPANVARSCGASAPSERAVLFCGLRSALRAIVPRSRASDAARRGAFQPVGGDAVGVICLDAQRHACHARQPLSAARLGAAALAAQMNTIDAGMDRDGARYLLPCA